MKKKQWLISVVIFAVLIYGISALCIFAPKDEYSESERRVLAKLPDFSKGIDGNINKIEVWDRKLYDYMTDKAKRQEEAKAKAEEEAKKAKAAAALDF